MSGRQYLLYTTSVGGLLNFGVPDRYAAARATGSLDITPVDMDRSKEGFEPTLVAPSYIALVETVADFDFEIGSEVSDRPLL